MFDWNDLRFFLEVAHGQSLSSAAKKFGVNHTTVARRIQALEESLDARLFDKTPTGYKLVPAGTKLLKIASQVETLCVSAQELVAGQDQLAEGMVRLSIPEAFGSNFLVRYLGEFQKKYPSIQLNIVTTLAELSVSKREVDIAITTKQLDVGRLIVRPLTNYTMRYYASKSYLERSPKIRDLDSLNEHDVITGRISMSEFESMNDFMNDSQAKLRFKGANALAAAISSGLGVGLLPYYMAFGKEDLVPVLPNLKAEGTFWISKHEDMRNIGRVSAVWEWIKMIVETKKDELVAP